MDYAAVSRHRIPGLAHNVKLEEDNSELGFGGNQLCLTYIGKLHV